MSKILPTLIVLVILAGLGYYVAEFEQEPMAELTVPKIVVTERNLISQIELSDTEKKTQITLQKGEGDSWKVKAPLEAETDSGKIDTLLTRLEKLKASRLLEEATEGDKIDLSKYGLDSPSHSVSWIASNKSYKLLIGKESPLGANGYAKLEGEDRVYLVNSGDLEILKKDLFTFRDKTVLETDKDQVRELTVTKAAGDRWRFVNPGDGTWRIEEPFQAAGDPKLIGDMVNDLGRLEALEFVAESAEDLKQYGLATPEITCKLVMKEGDAVKTVHFGKRKESDATRIHAKRETRPNVYLVEARLIKSLASSPDELRDKTVFPLGSKEIASVTVEKGGLKVSAARGDDGKWTFQSPRTNSDPGSSGTQLLDKLKGLKASRFVPAVDVKPEEFGLDKPTYRVSIGVAASTDTSAPTELESHAIRVGKSADGGRYVEVEGEDLVLVSAEDFGWVLDGFHKSYSELLSFDDWNLKALEIVAGDRTESYEVNDKAEWIRTGQKAATEPLKDRIKAFASSLPHLMPLAWVPDGNLAEHGLETPAYRVTVKTKDGKPDVKFALGNKDGKYGFQMEGTSGIAIVPMDLYTRAGELLATAVPEETEEAGASTEATVEATSSVQ